MRRLLNFIISKIKNEEFRLDEHIPVGYLIRFFINKVICLVWGVLYVRRAFCFIHPSSTIKCKSKLNNGRNLNIDRGCYIDTLSTDGVTFGTNCSVGKNTTIECSGSLKSIGKGITVGNNVGLGTHGFFGCAGGVRIGSDTIFGNYVSLHSENHNFTDLSIPIRLQGVNRKGIFIGDNCWIGAKVTILDGAKIGNGCIIAAGSVVIQGDYADNGIYGGVPAKLIKMR